VICRRQIPASRKHRMGIAGPRRIIGFVEVQHGVAVLGRVRYQESRRTIFPAHEIATRDVPDPGGDIVCHGHRQHRQRHSEEHGRGVTRENPRLWEPVMPLRFRVSIWL